MTELLLPLQQAAGRATDEAVMMWNPPWSLAVVLPLGLLPARAKTLTLSRPALVMRASTAVHWWLRWTSQTAKASRTVPTSRPPTEKPLTKAIHRTMSISVNSGCGNNRVNHRRSSSCLTIY